MLHDGVSPWPFSDSMFDCCLLLFVLHHIASEDALKLTLSEARRVSKCRVLVLEDQPRAAESAGMSRLATAVTSEREDPTA